MSGLIVVGTDTGAGKTWLCAALMAAVPAARYWKPWQTGVEQEPPDRAMIARLSGADESRLLPDGVTLSHPSAPAWAARVEGREPDPGEIEGAGREHLRHEAPLIIEGAGGLLVPLGPDLLLVDWLLRFELPFLVAASTRLGGTNHALLTLEALERRDAGILGLVFMGDPVPWTESGVATHTRVPVLGRIPTLAEVDRGVLAAHARVLLQADALAACLTPTA